jgi:hypothetical protein
VSVFVLIPISKEWAAKAMSSSHAPKLVALTLGLHALAGLAVGDVSSGDLPRQNVLPAFVGFSSRNLVHRLHPTLCCKVPHARPSHAAPSIRMVLSEERNTKNYGLPGATTGLQRGGSMGNEATTSGAGDAVCFDGGCMTDSSSSMEKSFEMLDRELEALGDTERRLRREGALMLLEKLRNQGIQNVGAVASPKQEEDEEEAAQSIQQDGAAPVGSSASLVLDSEQSIITQRLAGRAGPTVWSEFGALAAQTKGVNLGQGFPNWSPPAFVIEAAVEAISKGGAAHQYTRTAGHPPLCALLAARYRKLS